MSSQPWKKFLCRDPPEPAAGINTWRELFPATVPVGGDRQAQICCADKIRERAVDLFHLGIWSYWYVTRNHEACEPILLGSFHILNDRNEELQSEYTRPSSLSSADKTEAELWQTAFGLKLCSDTFCTLLNTCLCFASDGMCCRKLKWWEIFIVLTSSCVVKTPVKVNKNYREWKDKLFYLCWTVSAVTGTLRSAAALRTCEVSSGTQGNPSRIPVQEDTFLVQKNSLVGCSWFCFWNKAFKELSRRSVKASCTALTRVRCQITMQKP